MSFGSDLKKFQRTCTKRVTAVKREASFTMFSSIVIATPVDKGVLVGNWFCTFSRPSKDYDEYGEGNAGLTNSEIEYVLRETDLERDIFLTNNSPYGVPIEYDGHSAKAPRGMVRINLLKWDAIVAKAASKAKRDIQ